MEKQPSCDSMTTVTVKDFNPQMDYQEPPPAYRPMKTTPMVQVAKIVAYAAVAIAGMLSFAIVFSAWLTNSSCQQQLQQLQQQQQHQQQQQPSFEALIQPESLKTLLALGTTGPAPASLVGNKDNSHERGANDLDSAESKTNDQNNSKNDSSSSEEEEDNNNSGEEAVTMLKLPVELSFQEHMFDRNHRSHMNCIIEKKKAEEIVDEQAKALPPLLGINLTTDPRYLHFTGEKMAISCDSGNDHRHPPPPPPQAPYQGNFPFMETMMVAPPPPSGSRHHPHHHSHQGHPMPIPFGASSSRDSSPAQTLASAIAAASSSSVPIQIIGPIPLSGNSQSEPLFPPSSSSSSSGPFGGFGGLSAQMIPILVSSQGNGLDDLQSSSQGNSDSIFLGPVVAPQASSPHHHHQIHYQPIPQQQQQQSAPMHHSAPVDAQFSPFLADPSSHPFQFSPAGVPPQPQSAELRERAVPHPIPIMPRAHVQHVIRPRRSVDNVEKKRVKRCSCDCACKNHQE